jgi:hypothetical protein
MDIIMQNRYGISIELLYMVTYYYGVLAKAEIIPALPDTVKTDEGIKYIYRKAPETGLSFVH